jgi:hypothetical protein
MDSYSLHDIRLVGRGKPGTGNTSRFIPLNELIGDREIATGECGWTNKG